jgi:hypothetical protein
MSESLHSGANYLEKHFSQMILIASSMNAAKAHINLRKSSMRHFKVIFEHFLQIHSQHFLTVPLFYSIFYADYTSEISYLLFLSYY